MSYYIIQNGETNGPYTISQLRAMWNSGAITGETLYCQEGWSEWLPLSAMIGELEPSAYVPPYNTSQPPVLLQTPKSKRGIAMVVGLVCLGVIVLLVVTSGPSHNSNNVHESVITPDQAPPVDNSSATEPMSPSNYGLQPITIKLQDKLINALNQTDKLDAMIKRGCSFEEYASVFSPVEKSVAILQDALPSKDPRMYFFLATMERYQLLGLKLSKNESKDELSDVVLSVSITKALLLQVLNGTLDENEQRMFNDAKQLIQSGKM